MTFYIWKRTLRGYDDELLATVVANSPDEALIKSGYEPDYNEGRPATSGGGTESEYGYLWYPYIEASPE